jgi:hypothetical protein
MRISDRRGIENGIAPRACTAASGKELSFFSKIANLILTIITGSHLLKMAKFPEQGAMGYRFRY